MDCYEISLSDKDRKKTMRNVVFAQCFGTLGMLLFENGILLLFLLALGISQTRVMSYLAVPWACFILTVPAAYYAGRIGKKKVGASGNLLCVLGVFSISCAGFASGTMLREIISVFGIVVLAVGLSMFQSSWFALLRPIVPAEIRGRFFGNLRLSWQISCIIISGISAWILSLCSSLWVYQAIIAALAVMILGRSFFYDKIPEIDKPCLTGGSFREAFMKILRLHNYASFGAYIFLIKMFTAYCPTIFALLEKQVLHLDSGTVIWLANMGLAGSLAGFFIGGWLIDKIGAKMIFVICHLAFALVLGLFVMRGFCGSLTLMPVLWVSHFFFNLAVAASSIAITTEILSMLPVQNSALASSLLMAFVYGGTAIAGFIGAAAIDLGFLMEKWTLWNMEMSRFDSILLACAAMILLLTVTLGLVPSVLASPKDDLPC
jgi:MFS family permease